MTGLQQLRLDSRLTVKELADQAGVSVPTILGIESGDSRPRMDTLAKLADHFKVPPSVLILPAKEAA